MQTTTPLSALKPLHLAILACLMPASAVAADALQAIDVISTTPLHGLVLEAKKVPANVSIASDEEFDKMNPLDVSEFMNRAMSSVFINEATTNPLQPDVQYRGFVASPLMGLPQGLSVYVDGVRVNEPFGDTVNWSLIPHAAIQSINLMPGSNPMFGLNTLGGALSVITKNGFDDQGTQVQLSGGSFGRITTELETGGHTDNLSYYLTTSWFDEDGWRDYSPSEVAQAFGNFGWRNDSSTLNLSIAVADTDLIGNGPLPTELLEEDRASIFTRPDRTENSASMFKLGGTHSLSDTVLLEAQAYVRNSDMDTLNGDDSDYGECDDDPTITCLEGEDEATLDTDGNTIAFDDEVDGGTLNRSKTRQDTRGASAQVAFLNDLSGRENQFIAGLAVESSDVNFRSSTELGSLDDTRQAIGSGILVEDAFVHLKTETTNQSIYFTDTWSLSSRTALTLSGRYNNTDIKLKDQLGTALNGDHSYSRFNPAAGVTFDVKDNVNLFAGYSESSRAPSPMELTCADPEDPCRLPNAFLSDPPLQQVVAKTFEVGARGNTGNINWNAAVFHTVNNDDIQFISAGALTNQGYFKNIGDTRRLGLELGISGEAVSDRLNWNVGYTLLNATYKDNFNVSSPNHPNAVDGEISVEKGDRLAGLPEHALKLGARFAVTGKLSIGTDMQYTSSLVMRGDESNEDDEIDGYTVVNLQGDYQMNQHLMMFARVNNVFDTEYETFGLYGEADEVLGEEDADGDDDDEDGSRFLSPGAPRAAWIGIKYQF